MKSSARAPARNFPAAAKENRRAILQLLKQDDAELSIALIGNAEIRKLNAQYRKKDYATDVLSFPAGEGLPTDRWRCSAMSLFRSTRRENRRAERGRTLDQEMVTLLIHGIVHLLGYDHERSAKDARVMKRLENKIYRALCERGLIQV